MPPNAPIAYEVPTTPWLNVTAYEAQTVALYGGTSAYEAQTVVLLGGTSAWEVITEPMSDIALRPLYTPLRFQSAGYAQAVLADSPIAYWRFETGSLTADSSSNNRTLVEVTSPTPDQEPVINEGKAALLDTDDYFYIDDASIGALTTYTWECWFRPTDTSSGAIGQIMGFEWTSGHSIPISIRQEGSAIQFQVFTGSVWQSVHSFTQTIGNNYHLVMVRDGTSYEAFVNGASANTATISPSATVRDRVQIGKRWDNSEYTRGVIDEAAIYSTALSSSRIASHYNAGAP